jgi:hypothetical protein
LFHLNLVIASGLWTAELPATGPPANEPPIPEAAALMKEVKAHQEKMDEVRENYTFHRIRKVDELDGKGTVKKTTIQEREVFYVNGRQIGRLVKRDEIPLSEAEDKKEQERVRKLTTEFSEKPPAFGRSGGVNLINMILAVSEVSNPRRTQMNGRSTLIFDFKGDPKADAHSMEEKGARKVEGTLWVDEADRQVAWLEVEFYDNFRIAGGLLASIQKGTIMKIEQSPIGEGLWMTTANEQHMNLRVIVKGVHENTQVTNFDFKRFNVDAVQRAPK